MIWASTTKVACAGSSFKVDHKPFGLFYCFYYPRGNIVNKPIYEAGDTASNCPSQRSDKWLSLCSIDVKQIHKIKILDSSARNYFLHIDILLLFTVFTIIL